MQGIALSQGRKNDNDFVFFMILIRISILSAQVTNLIENFDDTILTGWEVPTTQVPTYQSEESDSILKITYASTADRWEWDNLIFTPLFIIFKVIFYGQNKSIHT